MVFKKPYAFFIKYFKLINFLLVIFLGVIFYKLNLLRIVLKDIYLNNTINYSSLSYDYIGFRMYLFIFLAIVSLSIILLLLRKKKKPVADYGYALIYILVIIIFLGFVNSLFYTLSNITIEPSELKIYSDISSLILLPMLYFIFKFFMISIGFNLKKFDFTKDLIELRNDIDDDEEIELDFTKDSYKYKRKFRKFIREFKYYMLENKLVYSIIAVVIFIVLFSTLLAGKFDSNEVKLNKQFVANGFAYTINKVYETSYDYNRAKIKKDSKFVILDTYVNRIFENGENIDFKKIRLLFDDKFVYSSNYYNEYFLDLGNGYNGQKILSGEKNRFLFIFKVPNTYNSNEYEIKFYDKNITTEKEYNASYKLLKVKASKLDTNYKEYKRNFNEIISLEKDTYGDSSITIKNLETLYKYQEKDKLVLPKDINDMLLYFEYNLILDKDNKILSNISDKEFFRKYTVINYTYNGKRKTLRNLNVIDNFDNKIFFSIPYNIVNRENLEVSISFRDSKYILKLIKN